MSTKLLMQLATMGKKWIKKRRKRLSQDITVLFVKSRRISSRQIKLLTAIANPHSLPSSQQTQMILKITVPQTASKRPVCSIRPVLIRINFLSSYNIKNSLLKKVASLAVLKRRIVRTRIHHLTVLGTHIKQKKIISIMKKKLRNLQRV